MFYQKLLSCFLCLDIVKMDWKSICTDRLSTEYEKDVEEFINFVVEHADNLNHINCPWIKCDCLDKIIVEVLRDHLFIKRFDTSYIRWIWHGESTRKNRHINLSDRRCDGREEVECDEGDKLENIMHDVDEYFVDHPHLFERLKNDAEKSLYVGSKFTKLSANWDYTIW